MSEMPLSIPEFEVRARALQAGPSGDALYAPIPGGAWRTNLNNRLGFAAYDLRPHGLSGVEFPDLSTTVLGTRVSLPVLVGPSGNHMRAHKDGEAATARGATSARSGGAFARDSALSAGFEARSASVRSRSRAPTTRPSDARQTKQLPVW